MGLSDLSKFDLGDFFLTGSDRILDPGPDYAEWRRMAAPVFDLFEPELLDGPDCRTRLATGSGDGRVINLASYNYLGLSRHPRVMDAAIEAIRHFGTGACGSPVLSGMTVLHRDLERAYAAFLGREQAILFNSGNAGAIGALSAVLRKGDVAILDQYAHICLIEGAKLAGARVEMFAHNDAADLDRVLKVHASRRRLVIVEGLYSMHGDLGALDALVPVAKAHGAEVFVDEAHSILALGANGRGAAEVHGVEADVDLSYGTFSKAFGNAGAALAGSSTALDYIRFFANTYVFSVALPPAVVAGVRAALDVSTSDPGLRARLAANADRYRAGLSDLGIDTSTSCAHIVPIVVGSDRMLLYELTASLRRNGLFVAPVDYPSVPENQLRLRTCVTAAHRTEDIDEALGIIEHVVVPRLGRGKT